MDKKWITILMITLLLVLVKDVRAESMSFNFADPKGVNSISIILDSVLEPIMGIASGISGNVIFDPATKKAMKGKIVVQADKIQMTNQMMTKVLHSEEGIGEVVNDLRMRLTFVYDLCVNDRVSDCKLRFFMQWEYPLDLIMTKLHL